MEAMATQTVCAKCGGTGWMIVERANVSGAERCDCMAEGRAGRLEDRAQIPPLYEKRIGGELRHSWVGAPHRPSRAEHLCLWL